jgi:hypothetical protein
MVNKMTVVVRAVTECYKAMRALELDTKREIAEGSPDEVLVPRFAQGVPIGVRTVRPLPRKA